MMATLGMVAPAPAEARVNPLLIISRQIHKPNMLIVLDTSGSLTGVPGGSFATSSEVGVDCDDGSNCRGGDASGTCAASGKKCSSDGDCTELDLLDRHAGLRRRPPTARPRPASARSRPATRSVTAATPRASPTPTARRRRPAPAPRPRRRAARQRSARRPSSAPTAAAVAPARRRPARPTRSVRIAGGKLGTQQCNVDSDCPSQTTGGTCAVGDQVVHQGHRLRQALPRRRHHLHGRLRLRRLLEGLAQERRPTAPRPATARSRARRASPPPARAAPPTTTATSRPTPARSRRPATPASTPTPASASPTPARPARPTPASPARPATPARSPRRSGTGMCRTALTKCSKDSDCPTGDTCGPATSRFVIAKRVLSSIVDQQLVAGELRPDDVLPGQLLPLLQPVEHDDQHADHVHPAATACSQNNCYDDNSGPTSDLHRSTA